MSVGLRGLILNHYAKLAWDMPSDKEVAEGNVSRTEEKKEAELCDEFCL
jgi:hypothetical protein